MFADVKADVKQEIKELVAVSCNFLYEVPFLFEYIFNLILFSIPSSLIMSVKNKGGAGFNLMGHGS